MRDLSEVESTYVIALLDCCREKMTVNEVVKGKKIKVEGRGGGEAFVEEEIEDSIIKARDLIIVFGCPPNSYTPADSPLTVDFYINLNSMSDRIEKIVVLPDRITAWKPCGKGEVLNLTNHDLVTLFSAENNPRCLAQSLLVK